MLKFKFPKVIVEGGGGDLADKLKTIKNFTLYCVKIHKYTKIHK